MLRLIIEFVIFFVLLVVFTLPLRFVAAHVQRRFNQNKWLRSAAIVAFLTAVLGWSSRDLQLGCKQEFNEGCIDAGGAGGQSLLIGGYIIIALGSAYFMYND